MSVCLYVCVQVLRCSFVCLYAGVHSCVFVILCVCVCWFLSIHIFINHCQCLFICMFVYRVQQEAGLRPTHVLRLLWLESSCTDQGPHLPDMDKRLVFMGYRDKGINKHLPLCVPTFLIRSSIILLFVSFSFPAPPRTLWRKHFCLLMDWFILSFHASLCSQNLFFSVASMHVFGGVCLFLVLCLLSWVLFSASLICHTSLPASHVPVHISSIFVSRGRSAAQRRLTKRWQRRWTPTCDAQPGGREAKHFFVVC